MFNLNTNCRQIIRNFFLYYTKVFVSAHTQNIKKESVQNKLIKTQQNLKQKVKAIAPAISLKR